MNASSSNSVHWEGIYTTKGDLDVGWYQETPVTSLTLIDELGLDTDSAIIDIGGGNATLTQGLLDRGFCNLSVLDISEKALARTQKKMGPASNAVSFIASDIIACDQLKSYDLWHDRATFHFLLDNKDKQADINLVKQHLKAGGHMILATFSLSGPKTCSGLPIIQYSAKMLVEIFGETFSLKQAMDITHITPSGHKQPFTYTLFERQGY